MAKIGDDIKIIDDEVGEGIKSPKKDKHPTVNTCVAQLILNTRTQAGLSQRKLAQMIDTTQSVISRLEDSNYEGHSLSMLSRIAEAMEYEVKVDFIPIPAQTSQTK